MSAEKVKQLISSVEEQIESMELSQKADVKKYLQREIIKQTNAGTKTKQFVEDWFVDEGERLFVDSLITEDFDNESATLELQYDQEVLAEFLNQVEQLSQAESEHVSAQSKRKEGVTVKLASRFKSIEEATTHKDKKLPEVEGEIIEAKRLKGDKRKNALARLEAEKTVLKGLVKTVGGKLQKLDQSLEAAAVKLEQALAGELEEDTELLAADFITKLERKFPKTEVQARYREITAAEKSEIEGTLQKYIKNRSVRVSVVLVATGLTILGLVQLFKKEDPSPIPVPERSGNPGGYALRRNYGLESGRQKLMVHYDRGANVLSLSRQLPPVELEGIKQHMAKKEKYFKHDARVEVISEVEIALKLRKPDPIIIRQLGMIQGQFKSASLNQKNKRLLELYRESGGQNISLNKELKDWLEKVAELAALIEKISNKLKTRDYANDSEVVLAVSQEMMQWYDKLNTEELSEARTQVLMEILEYRRIPKPAMPLPAEIRINADKLKPGEFAIINAYTNAMTLIPPYFNERERQVFINNYKLTVSDAYVVIEGHAK